MSLNTAALMRYASGTIPAHTSQHDKAKDFPEYRDNLDLAFKPFSLGLASGAKYPLRTSYDGDIRLLEVFPHPNGSGRIRCAMHHYCFLVPARRISYSALSYVWGKGEENRLIVIDGKGFLVTENLQNILWHLREPSRSVYVWIDAICIYQAMKVEKQTQLGSMKDIYTTADETIIFLGEQADDNELVVPLLDLICEKPTRLNQSQPSLQIEVEDLERHGLPVATSRRWRALRKFLQREWFERKWCIQECVLAKSILCYLGTQTFDFHLLLAAYDLSMKHGFDQMPKWERKGYSYHKLGFRRDHALSVLQTLRNDVRRNFDIEANSEGKTLPWLLAATSYAIVSDRKDAIYALLGIYQVFNEMAALPYPSIVLEGRSVEDVFIDYACIDAWKKNDEDVSLLEVASLNKARSRLSLPSWVPDWTCSLPTDYLWKFLLNPTRPSRTGAGDSMRRTTFDFHRASKTLRVRGAQFDTLKSLTYKHYVDEDDDDEDDYDHDEEAERLGLDVEEQATTSNGHRAMVSESAKAGDSIFVICGERVPFVLRRAGSSWKLIGGAYIHCIMSGECLQRYSKHYLGDELQHITLV